jgi:hypothetical protein
MAKRKLPEVASMRKNFDIFSVYPTDTSVKSSNYISVLPMSDFKEAFRPVRFAIPPSSTQYIDLKSSYLYIRARVMKADGNVLSPTNIVAPSNVFFYSMFKSCLVSVNGTVVSDSGNTYPYRAAIPTLLKYG